MVGLNAIKSLGPNIFADLSNLGDASYMEKRH